MEKRNGLSICGSQTAKNTFPKQLRKMILQSAKRIPIEDMEQLLDKHEADAGNFDRRIESHLRKEASLDIWIHVNRRVIHSVKFNVNIVIDTPSASVCIKIEKGAELYNSCRSKRN